MGFLGSFSKHSVPQNMQCFLKSNKLSLRELRVRLVGPGLTVSATIPFCWRARLMCSLDVYDETQVLWQYSWIELDWSAWDNVLYESSFSALLALTILVKRWADMTFSSSFFWQSKHCNKQNNNRLVLFIVHVFQDLLF